MSTPNWRKLIGLGRIVKTQPPEAWVFLCSGFIWDVIIVMAIRSKFVKDKSINVLDHEI